MTDVSGASDHRVLVVRTPPRPGVPHAYDLVPEWVRENFPEHASLFQVELLPYELDPDVRFGLHVAWLRDPVEEWSMEVYDQATRLARACDERGIPVVNRVDRLINATKSRGAELMAGTGVRVPKMARIEDAEEFRDTLCGIPLPLILRDDWGHQGELLRADTIEEARALPVDRFARPIAVELIDTRDPRDGYYRKFRYFAAGDAGVPGHLQMSTGWITRGEARVKGENARYEELDYIGRADPNHDVLQRARRALGLDFIAFDYAYDHDGRVVVWEANPYPWLHFSKRGLTYRNAAMHRIMSALLKLYLDRAGLPVPPRLEQQLDYDRAPSTTWMGVSSMPIPRRERVDLRRMRVLGETSLDSAPGDRLSLITDCDQRSLKVLARRISNKTGVAVLESTSGADGESGYTVALDDSEPLRITLLADEEAASKVDGHFRIVRRPLNGPPDRQGWRVFRRSKTYRGPAVVVAAGQRVDQFRVVSSLKRRKRFCLAAFALDGGSFSGLPWSPVIEAPYRYCDIGPGATLIANPFADGGDYIAVLMPWAGPDDDADGSVLSSIEAWRIVDLPGAPEGTAPAAGAVTEAARLWGLRKSFEAYVEALIEVAKTASAFEIRQAAIDRLVECNRCPQSLLALPRVQAHAAASFRRALLTWNWKAHVGRIGLDMDRSLEMQARDKRHSYRLAEMLGMEVPRRQGPVTAEESLLIARDSSEPVVLKPARGKGASGVFVVHSATSILDLKARVRLADLEALAARMSSHRGAEWMVEEYLAKPGDPLCPAPDIKFYSFYGRVGLVLEVERYPEARHAWWLRDGQRAETGKYEGRTFEGDGFSPEQLDLAERVSGALPFPFMRLDFLKAGGRFLLGEFTPQPGGFEAFNVVTDRRLGALYLDAELRLTRDLLAGKRFDTFMEWAKAFLPSSADSAAP